MKIMTINLGWTQQSAYISNHELADAAYKKITDAMANYKEYGNDKERTVTIDTGHAYPV